MKSIDTIQVFGERSLDYTIKEDALKHISRGRCPFTGEQTSDDKYVHVGKFKTTNSTTKLKIYGLKHTCEYDIESWYLKVSESFYHQELKWEQRIRKAQKIFVGMLLIGAILLTLLVTQVFSEDISVVTLPFALFIFFGGIITSIVLKDKRSSRLNKRCKICVKRTTKLPHYGIPTLETVAILPMLESKDVETSIKEQLSKFKSLID